MSDLEDALVFQIRVSGLPEPDREYRFAPPRRFRADLAYPERRILIECEGGQFTRGRHVRPMSYANDCDKYNLAQLMGYKVLRFTRSMIDEGDALTTIKTALER